MTSLYGINGDNLITQDAEKLTEILRREENADIREAFLAFRGDSAWDLLWTGSGKECCFNAEQSERWQAIDSEVGHDGSGRSWACVLAAAKDLLEPDAAPHAISAPIIYTHDQWL